MISFLHIDEINKYFRKPLKEKLGKEKEKEIDTIFNDFDLLRATSKEVLSKLTNLAKVGSVFWLSDVYVSSKSYMHAHQMFYRGHTAGLTLFITLRERDAAFRQVLGSCCSRRYKDATLMDLFYYVSSRFAYICEMAQAQYNALKAFNDLGQSIRAASRLHTEVLRSPPPRQHAQQQARCGKDSTISGTLLAEAQGALDRLREVDAAAAGANAIHRVAHLVRTIKQSVGGRIPDSPSRTLLAIHDVSLRNKCAFGLSSEVPARLVVFSDGVALCTRLSERQHMRSTSSITNAISTHSSLSNTVYILKASNSSTNNEGHLLSSSSSSFSSSSSSSPSSSSSSVNEYKYRLIEWYTPGELWITRIADTSDELVLRFSKLKQSSQTIISGSAAGGGGGLSLSSSSSSLPLMSSSPTPADEDLTAQGAGGLPPGWEDSGKGKKRVYTYKACGITQTQAPEAPPARTSVHDVVLPTGEVRETCLRALAQCVGSEDCVHAEVRRAPYKMFGASLGAILAYEQTFSPWATTPHLLRMLNHIIISKGVGEPGVLSSASDDTKKADELAGRIDAGQWAKIRWGDISVQAAAPLAKRFIRELVDGVIPGEVYDRFLAVARSNDICALRRLLTGLPKASYSLLEEVLFALSQVAANSHVNRMDAKAIAAVAAPCIMVRNDGNFNIRDFENANRVTEIMIANYRTLFPAAAPLPSPERPENPWAAFRRKLVGHKKSIKVLAALPDERRVLSIDGSGLGILWDAAERLHVKTINFGADYPAASAFGPDATTLWVGRADSVLVYDMTAAFALRATLRIPGFSLLRVGSSIWCGGEGVIRVVAADTPRFDVVAEIKMSAPIIVSSMVEVPTENAIWASGHCKGAENSIYVVDRDTLAEIISFQAHSQKINALAMCHGNVWSCSDDSTIRVWNTRNFRLIEKLGHHSGAVYGLCPLTDQVWSCSWDKTICVWDIDSLRYLGVINGYHTDSIMGIIRVGAKRDVWSQSADKSICVWEVQKLLK